MTETSLKRGTRISYRHAAGKITAGKVLRKSAQLDRWWVLHLVDEHGTFNATCHEDQITIIDNRHVAS